MDEWRNIDWDIDEEEDMIVGDRRQSDMARDSAAIGGHLFRLFDWELQFFKHIPRTQQNAKEYDDAVRMIRKIENNKKWQARVKKRSIAYF